MRITALDRRMADNRLHVVVGVIEDRWGRLLIQQRRPGTPRAGQWEFPGGKLEPGETPEVALSRELEEELGIQVTHSSPLVSLGQDYDHAHVWLDTWWVTEFQGQPAGNEGQAIAWVAVESVPQYDVLEAVHPILDAFRSRSRPPGSPVVAESGDSGRQACRSGRSSDGGRNSS